MNDAREVLRRRGAGAQRAVGRRVHRGVEAARTPQQAGLRACALDRTFNIAVFDLAQAYFHIGEFQRSIAVYTFALTIDKRHNIINTNLAMAYAMVGNLDQAKQLFYQVIESDKKNIDARDGLAQVLLAEGDKQGALTQWKYVLTVDPTHKRAQSAVRDL